MLNTEDRALIEINSVDLIAAIYLRVIVIKLISSHFKFDFHFCGFLSYQMASFILIFCHRMMEKKLILKSINSKSDKHWF